MSEEEIIKILENTIKTSLAGQWDYSAIEIAIKGLLDLYNKEKEKNKELICTNDKLKSTKRIRNYEDECRYFIPKDRIRERIKELEEEQKEYKGSQEWEIQDDIDAQINILKELLGE